MPNIFIYPKSLLLHTDNFINIFKKKVERQNYHQIIKVNGGGKIWKRLAHTATRTWQAMISWDFRAAKSTYMSQRARQRQWAMPEISIAAISIGFSLIG